MAVQLPPAGWALAVGLAAYLLWPEGSGSSSRSERAEERFQERLARAEERLRRARERAEERAERARARAEAARARGAERQAARAERQEARAERQEERLDEIAARIESGEITPGELRQLMKSGTLRLRNPSGKRWLLCLR